MRRSKKPPSKRGLRRHLKVTLHRLKQAISNFKQRWLYLSKRWLPLRLYWIKCWLLAPVRLPKRLPRWFWIVVAIAILLFLAFLFAPRRIARSYYGQFRSLPDSPVEEGGELLVGVYLPWGGGFVKYSCTYYVATIYPETGGLGNAYQWDERARERGWRVDQSPEVGAIGQTDYSGYGGLGHVAYIEAVSEDGTKIKYSDMNSGLGGYGTGIAGYSGWENSSIFEDYIHL